LQQRSCFYH
jgi:hypothetical protein